MATLTLALVLVLATVLLAPLAQRMTLPYPAVLLLFGLLVTLIPGVGIPQVNPDLILPLLLPPLLFAAARRTSWREFLDNRRAIGLLAVALVAVTAFAVAAVAAAIVPGLPILAALALGAAVGPPDAVAATAVARKLGLPRRLRTILEGEGLSNDATALVLYEVAVAAALTGALSPWKLGTALATAVVVGVGVGLLSALLSRWLLARLPAHPAGSALVLVIPFAAYVAADAAHGSGVLAVVTVALALSRYSDVESSQTRLVANTTWEILELVLVGAAFAFVGLELRFVAAAVDGPISVLIWQALAITAVVIVIRFAWIFPVASLDERLRKRSGGPAAEPVGWREMSVASWAGMRGVVTLAAVLALPANFPQRDRLIFIAFVVIIVTLLVQGLTLPALARRLRVAVPQAELYEAEQKLIRRARDASFARLDELQQHHGLEGDVLDHARENAERMWHSLGFQPEEHSDEENAVHVEHAQTSNAIKDELLAAARRSVVEARTESGTDPALVDTVLRRLDARGTHPEE
ncbi:MAG: Na+/H+ antiporter [Mycobacterium sp.]